MHRQRLPGLAAFGLVALLGLGAGQGRTEPRATSAEAVFLDTLNEWRAARRVRPVTLDDRLTRAAVAHVGDMVASVGCSHTGRDGSSFDARARAQGYPSPSGEVLACRVSDPHGAFDLLRRSPAHRQILSDPDHRQVGIAALHGMWAVVFGRG
jgi:uncharacterized protein YkwD